ncbi:MAG: hypothetical protein AAGK02_03975, partial [Pseudomonadota bacterium]
MEALPRTLAILATAWLLQGCVAAVPIIAGSAILRSETDGKKAGEETDAAVIVEAGNTGELAPTPATTLGPEGPEPDPALVASQPAATTDAAGSAPAMVLTQPSLQEAPASTSLPEPAIESGPESSVRFASAAP